MPDTDTDTNFAVDDAENIRKVKYVDLFGTNPDDDPDAPLIIPRIYKEAIVDSNTNEPIFSAGENVVTTYPKTLDPFLAVPPVIAEGLVVGDTLKTVAVNDDAVGSDVDNGLWTAKKINAMITASSAKIIDPQGNEYTLAFDENGNFGLKLVK